MPFNLFFFLRLIISLFIHADCIALGLCSNLRIGVVFIVVCLVMGPRVFPSHINYLDEFRLIFSTLMTAAVSTIRWVYILFVTVSLFGVVNKYDQRKIICCIYSNVTDFTIENTLFFCLNLHSNSLHSYIYTFFSSICMYTCICFSLIQYCSFYCPP